MAEPFVRRFRSGDCWVVKIKLLDGTWYQYNTKIPVQYGRDGEPSSESRAKARKARDRLQAAESRGEKPFAEEVAEVARVGDYFERFLNVKRLQVDRATLELYVITFRKWIELIGNTTIRELNSEQVARFAKKRLEGGSSFPNGKRRTVGKHTVNRDIRNLRTFVRWAEEEGIIQRAPKLREMKVVLQPYSRFTDAEMERIMIAAESVVVKGIPFSLIIGVAAATGLRISEELKLRWEWIQEDCIAVPPEVTKTDHALFIPMHAALRRLLDRVPRSGPLLFPISPRSGYVRDCWLKVCELAGVPHQKMHTLRHTAAGMFADQGVPPQVLQHVFHTSFETTMKYYLKPDRDSLERAKARLDDSSLGAALVRVEDKLIQNK